MPDRKCDLVMKGGITSGVVYPMAVVELAKTYSFQRIGGTSAGAIAAVVTAAAEYGRETGGFDRVATLPDELAPTLFEKFQPTPHLAPLFKVFLAAMSGSKLKILFTLVKSYFGTAMLAALPGLVLLLLALVAGSWGFAVLGILLAGIGKLAGAAYGAYRQAARDLPGNDFGLCPGATQPGGTGPGLTDWLADKIDSVAGLPAGSGPLTLKHLADKGITIATVTTDITTHRPYALPMTNNLHAFSENEFRRLFPARIVDHMVATSNPVDPETWRGGKKDLRYFRNEELPIVVLARMSLSFPGLFSQVPLHRIDFTLVHPDAESRRVIRCLFSDGGLSSNFPVHFFDQLLPQTPTFGISLGAYNPWRTRPQTPPVADDGRVVLPTEAGSGRLLPTHPAPSSLGAFAMSLFDSAKDWQDSLQSILPGYRERIVNVNLNADEGGMNLQMPPDTIRLLTDLGWKAGTAIDRDFDLNEHRWRRYLVEIQSIDTLLVRFARSYDLTELGGGALPYPKLATDYAPSSFKGLTKAQRAYLKAKAETIAETGRSLAAMAKPAQIDERMPSSNARLRNVARMDD